MGQNSAIEWTDHTFNPWRGCTKVSAGCANCYAEKVSKRNPRVLGIWGQDGLRSIGTDSYWEQPVRWNAQAAREKVRRRVFCSSLADVFEGPDTMPAGSVDAVRAARRRLFKLITATPALDWLLLTKRPENILPLTREAIDTWDDPEWDFNAAGDPNGLDVATFAELFPNVWLGTSVENQKVAEQRIPQLLQIPATVRFLSAEPLLGELEIYPYLGVDETDPDEATIGAGIGWVIVGCESGSNPRPMQTAWAQSIAIQTARAGVPFFMKQMQVHGHLAHAIEQFPPALQIRQFPKSA